METFQLALNLPGADEKEIHNYIEASHFSTDPADLATIGNDIKLQLSSFQDDIKKYALAVIDNLAIFYLILPIYWLNLCSVS